MSNENTGYLKWEEIKQEGLACTRLHERVLTLNMNMSRTQECPYWRDFCFSSESGEEEVEKVLIYFLSYITSTFFSLPDQRSKDQGSNYKGWKQR